MMMIGRAIVSGWLSVPIVLLDHMRTCIHESGEPVDRVLADLNLLSDGVLAQQGYVIKDGRLVGPRSCPTGAPPRYGLVEVADSGRGSSGGSGSGSVPISRAEARRGINITRQHRAWGDGLREHEIFVTSQNRRAWLIGRYVGRPFLKYSWVRAGVRQMVAAAGDAEEIEMWTDEDLRADYLAGELDEGGSK